MYIKVDRPDSPVEEQAIDTYLERGWYRTGQAWMTCRIVWFEGELYSSLWTRLALQGHTFKKSHRKILSKVHRTFEITHGLAVIDEEHEALYQRYKEHVSGSRWASLRSLLGISKNGVDLYPTEEITLRINGKLIAFSWFDRGSHALESLAGIYDPEFHQLSLGFATLLLEVEFAKKWGITHHYPGYLLPGASQMEYKRRMGPMEIYNPDDDSWHLEPEIPHDNLPLSRLNRALGLVSDAVRARGSTPYPVLYRAFEATAYNPGLSSCLRHPVAIGAGAQGGPFVRLIVWDIVSEQYTLAHCQHAVAVRRAEDGTEEPDPETPLLVVTRTDQVGSDPAKAAIALLTRN